MGPNSSLFTIPLFEEQAMIPGEVKVQQGHIELNAGSETRTVRVENVGDRPIQVGSHYHFYEVNPSLRFDRALARGFRLNIPSGTAVRFEPGQGREVELVPYRGSRTVYGFRGQVMGPLHEPDNPLNLPLPVHG